METRSTPPPSLRPLCARWTTLTHLFRTSASELRCAGASSSLPGYLGAIPVVGVGAVVGAFDYFHHGKDITVPKGTIFAVLPSNDPTVGKCRKSLKP